MRDWDEPASEPIETASAGGDQGETDDARPVQPPPTASQPLGSAADGADSDAHDPQSEDGWLPA